MEADMGARALLTLAVVACSTATPAQRVCEEYAATFAEVASNDCERGTLEDNLAAFKEASRVGSRCELVGAIRDQAALEQSCLPWLRTEVAENCALLDDGTTYLQAIPDACRNQLQLITP